MLCLFQKIFQGTKSLEQTFATSSSALSLILLGHCFWMVSLQCTWMAVWGVSRKWTSPASEKLWRSMTSFLPESIWKHLTAWAWKWILRGLFEHEVESKVHHAVVHVTGGTLLIIADWWQQLLQLLLFAGGKSPFDVYRLWGYAGTLYRHRHYPTTKGSCCGENWTSMDLTTRGWKDIRGAEVLWL